MLLCAWDIFNQKALFPSKFPEKKSRKVPAKSICVTWVEKLVSYLSVELAVPLFKDIGIVRFISRAERKKGKTK